MLWGCPIKKLPPTFRALRACAGGSPRSILTDQAVVLGPRSDVAPGENGEACRAENRSRVEGPPA